MLISSMNQKKHSKQKVVWLSPRKLVFEWETEVDSHFPWGYQVTEKKKILVIAEEGKDLYFLEDGGFSTEHDVLCFFCDYGIDLRLVYCGFVPSCLLGKDCGWVKFCRDFVPGPSFGEDKKRDMGERREAAEKVLAKIVWQNCSDCEHWNNKGVYTFADDGGVYENLEAAFCEILGKKPEIGYWKNCRSFEVSRNPEKRADYERRTTRLRDYIAELRVLEKQQPEKRMV